MHKQLKLRVDLHSKVSFNDFGVDFGGRLETYGANFGFHNAFKTRCKFPKQCLHYGVLAFSRAGKGDLPVRGSRTRKIIKKP